MARFASRPRSVITGAGDGFGRALAYNLAGRGARLVLSDIKAEGLEETATEAGRLGGEVITASCDVRDAAQVEHLAELADEHFGGTDIVANNAGIAVAGMIGEVSLDNWMLQLDVNLRGVIYGCHSFVPRMKKQGSGHILNVASAAGLVHTAMMGPYNVSKAGVVALTETLYGELEGTGVSCTALCPTFFRTNISNNAIGPSEKVLATARKLVDRSKWSAEQIAEIALDGLERGELHVVPQTDGKIMWGVKRLMPQKFYGLAAKMAKKQLGES